MRKLLLKVTTTTELDPTTRELTVKKPFPYRATLIGLLKYAPANQVGVDIEEMAKVLPIMQKLQAAEDEAELLLEDEEWRILKSRVETAKWSSADQAIIDLKDHIRSAPSTTLDGLRQPAKEA